MSTPLFKSTLIALSLLTPLQRGMAEQSVASPLAPLAPLQTQAADQNIYESIVRIEAATQVPNYKEPWKAGRFSGGIGTGFIIGPNRFLTNAHVVSNARRLLITMHGSARKHPAKILHIAHD